MTQLCATVTAETTAELRTRRDEASSAEGTDLVELRLDTVLDLDLDGALADRTCPVSAGGPDLPGDRHMPSGL